MERVTLTDWRKIPNLISIFRIVFVPIVFVLFNEIEQYRWHIISIIIIFSLLDNLDGFVARKLNQITELGKVLDPLIDKIFIIVIAFQMFRTKLIPDWFMVLVVGRDILIMLAGLIFLQKIKKVPTSDIIGKLTVGVIGFIFIISLLNFQKLELIYDILIILTSVLIFISLINYSYKQILRNYEKDF